MKYLLALLTTFSVTAAQASYMATHCSNADMSVTWESGHNSNTLTTQKTKVPFYDLDVQFSEETVLREEHVHNCQYMSNTKVFAAKVVITASAEKPNALDFLGENKKIETEVICKEEMSGRSACP